MSNARPLVTFALFTYNHERFVADAMRAALAQDYHPLEIIVSDDASPDGTWRVIEEIAASYRGPHELRIVRNPVNLGIGPHVSKVGREARGELVVLAAGDDISSPSRTTKLVEAWIANERPDGALHSAARERRGDAKRGKVRRGLAADPTRTTLDFYVRNGFRAIIHGATGAYTKSLFTSFPPLDADYEDGMLTFRALLLGRLMYVDAPLVEYRVGEHNISRSLKRREPERIANWFDTMQRQMDAMMRDYLDHQRRIGRPASSSVLDQLLATRRVYERGRGLASPRYRDVAAAMLAYPRHTSLARWANFYLHFFGLLAG